MKLFRNLFKVILVATVLLASCEREAKICPSGAENSLSFSALIVKTKAHDASWDTGDAVGIYMIKNAQVLADATQLSANKKYTTPGDGKFTAAPGSEIEFPVNGDKVDFISYYPYKESIQNFSYNVDISNQKSQAAIDLLYSNNSKGLNNNSNGAIALNFKHVLSKVILNISKGPDQLTGLKAKITGMMTNTVFDLTTGKLGAATKKADIEMAVKADGTMAEAIVIPSETAITGAKIIFTLGTDTYTYDLPPVTQYEASKKHEYNVVLKREGVVLVSPVATITDWVGAPSVDIVVDKDNNVVTPPVENTLFKETLGNKENLTSKFPPETYPYYDNKAPIVFGGSNVDIRTTKVFKSHIWFGASKETSFTIKGLNTTGYTKMKLTFDITANLFKDGASVDINILKVKCGDAFVTVPSMVLTKADGYLYKYYSVTIENLPNDFNSLEFLFDTSNTLGFRISNIGITGTK